MIEYSVYSRALPNLCTSLESFKERLAVDDDTKTFHAYENNQVVGFAMVRGNGLQLLCVLPEYQGRGIGSRLLGDAENFVQSKGHDKILLGIGHGKYLMQGAVEPSSGFFISKGYQADWVSVDMVLKLSEYQADPLAASVSDVRFGLATREHKAKIMSMIKEHQPPWAEFYKTFQGEIVIAESERIMGSVMLVEDQLSFAACFDGPVGGLGCLLVEPAYRERGIGLGLAAAATSRLKQLGFEYSYVGYTWLEDWYGRLGYRTFQRFWMGEKSFSM